MKKLFLILVANVFFLTCTVYASENSEWMSSLSDSMPVSIVSIPGTHDSAAYKMNGASKILSPWAKTQDKSISQQLDMGVRYFDLRVYDDMSMHHGIAWVGESLLYHLKEINSFLELHPREFVIVRLKNEQGTNITEDYTFLKNIVKVIPESGVYNKLYTKVNSLPVVKDVRGKIVMIDDTGGWLMPFSAYNYRKAIFIQDNYKDVSIDEKLRLVTTFINGVNTEYRYLSLNHLSFTNSPKTIYNVSMEMNTRFDKWFVENKDNLQTVGITIVDFANQTLINNIIDLNSKNKKVFDDLEKYKEGDLSRYKDLSELANNISDNIVGKIVQERLGMIKE